jgi:hypothetical protein
MTNWNDENANPLADLEAVAESMINDTGISPVGFHENLYRTTQQMYMLGLGNMVEDYVKEAVASMQRLLSKYLNPAFTLELSPSGMSTTIDTGEVVEDTHIFYFENNTSADYEDIMRFLGVSKVYLVGDWKDVTLNFIQIKTADQTRIIPTVEIR